jgi:tetratricopeptide (TPR) repeat protein
MLKFRSTTSSLWIVFSAILFGLFLGQLLWYVVPFEHKTDKALFYMVTYGKALESRKCGDYHGSRQLLEKLINKYPENYEAYRLLGDIELDRGNTEEALRLYETALFLCGAGPTNLTPYEAQQREKSTIADKISILKQSNIK